MNNINVYVVDILSDPEEKNGRWWVEVRLDKHGSISKDTLPFDTLEGAEKLEVGNKFLR